jgi:MbtH protein
MSEQENTSIYNVVVNHEEQYSIWPAGRENAPGWRDAGFRGTKDECLAYVKEHWTDMRPLSLRLQMEARQQPAVAAAGSTTSTTVAVEEAPPVVASTPVMETPVSPVAADIPSSPPQVTGDAPIPNAAADDKKQNKGFFGRLFGRG